MPLGQLRDQILVVEASLFEEGALHEADQILDRSFLLRPVRPAHIDADAELERRVGEGRIPFGDHAVPLPLQRDRLRPIEDAHQRSAAPAVEMLGEVADQRLRRLVRDQRHPDGPRVLQPRGEEADPLDRPVDVLDVHLPEVVLAEFAGQPLEADQRVHRPRPHRRDERVQRALASGVPIDPCAPQDLERRQPWGLAQNLFHEAAEASTWLGRPMPRRARSAGSSTSCTAASSAIRFTDDTDTPARRAPATRLWPALSSTWTS